MKTVQDYLDLGLVFVDDDKLRSSTNNKDYKEVCMSGLCIANQRYCEGFRGGNAVFFYPSEWTPSSFAWRNNDGVKPKYKGLIDVCLNNAIEINGTRTNRSLWERGYLNSVAKWRPVVLQSDNANNKIREKFLSALRADSQASKNVLDAIRGKFCLPVGIESPELREAFKSLKDHLENKPPFWNKSIKTLNCPCTAVNIEAIKPTVSTKEYKPMKPVYTAEMHAKGEVPPVGAECLVKVDNSLRFNRYTVMYISNSGSMVLRRVESEIDLVGNVDSCEFKPIIKTIKVNGFDVPAPMSEAPEVGGMCFVASINNPVFFYSIYWETISCNKTALSRGLVHSNKSAAIAHAKAMLGIDPNA